MSSDEFARPVPVSSSNTWGGQHDLAVSVPSSICTRDSKGRLEQTYKNCQHWPPNHVPISPVMNHVFLPIIFYNYEGRRKTNTWYRPDIDRRQVFTRALPLQSEIPMPILTEAAVNVFIPAVITFDVLGSTPPSLYYEEIRRKYLVCAHQRCCPGVEESGGKCKHPKTSKSLAPEDHTTSLLTLNRHVLHNSPCNKSHKAHRMSNGPSKVGTQLETESTHKG